MTGRRMLAGAVALFALGAFSGCASGATGSDRPAANTITVGDETVVYRWDDRLGVCVFVIPSVGDEGPALAVLPGGQVNRRSC